MAESPRGASPLPPSQLQEDGEEQSGALWLPSPTAPGDGGTVPAAEATVVTPWHTEVPGGSDAAATGHEAVPQTPGTGTPAASSEEEEEKKEKEEEKEEEEEEEERPVPSVATVEGFLAAVPGEPGGTLGDGLTSPRAGVPGVSPAGTPLGDPAPSTAAPLPALPTERASLGAGASSAGDPRHRAALALGAALLAVRWH